MVADVQKCPINEHLYIDKFQMVWSPPHFHPPHTLPHAPLPHAPALPHADPLPQAFPLPHADGFLSEGSFSNAGQPLLASHGHPDFRGAAPL